MSKDSLWKFIHKYDQAIVKPEDGSGGSNVFLVSSKKNGKYKIRYNSTSKTFKGKQKVYSFLKKKMGRRGYIVQKKIALAKWHGRPFDIRVMVQRKRKRNSSWTVTGKLAKVAGKGFIITNVARSKGKVISLENAIRHSLSKNASKAIHSEIDRIVLLGAKQLSTYYKWIRVVGFDLGLDRKGKVWIIEPNFAPNKSLFLKLKDKKAYRRIMSYN